MPLSKFISRPCSESQGSPSSTDHQGSPPSADDEADKPGGSRRLAGLICDRVRSAGLSDSIKFEAKKIKKGGKKNIFKQEFQFREGEKLFKASHCCLSTEAGPVAGLLFISTERVAFCSQRSITSGFHGGLPIETDQKIEIPISNIREISPKDPQQKNMIILTTDNSEFQFMDFLRYDKAYQNLQEAIIWQSADDGADKPGGSRRLAGLICDRVRSAGLSDSIKFEAKKIKKGGKKNIFKQEFQVREGEKLFKASHCCLSTEAGPVAGLLSISSERIAFCSQRSITSGFHGGLPIETDQKIEIPIWNIRETSPKDPQQKNMTILTADNSEFQFMDFLRYDKAYQNLQAAIRKAKSSK
uniref:GRAM domain-containing protein n=1 Tax=Salix viminalis TaxID=40686 RepID=A0A6N2N6C9_SALVM